MFVLKLALFSRHFQMSFSMMTEHLSSNHHFLVPGGYIYDLDKPFYFFKNPASHILSEFWMNISIDILVSFGSSLQDCLGTSFLLTKHTPSDGGVSKVSSRKCSCHQDVWMSLSSVIKTSGCLYLVSSRRLDVSI